MNRLMMTAAALALLTATAHAGSNTCEGTIQIGDEWTTVKSNVGDYSPDGCRFKTKSKLGRRILAICPNNSECMISIMPLDNRSPTLTSISSVNDQGAMGKDDCEMIFRPAACGPQHEAPSP